MVSFRREKVVFVLFCLGFRGFCIFFFPLGWVGGCFWYFLPQISSAHPAELATSPVHVPSLMKDDQEITDFLLCSLGCVYHLVITTI